MANLQKIAVNENGLRIGEDHQRAKLTDHEVDTIRELHEGQGYGYRRLAKMFNVHRMTIRDICKYRKRWQIAARVKTVCVP